MQQSRANPYLKTKILTAGPEELRLMLYEGAIRFCRQAREALTAEDFEASYHALMRAQKIVLELSTSLNHQVAPDLCSRLGALYTYIYRLLVDANIQRQAAPVAEALQLLEFERETWQILIQRLAEHGGQDTAAVHADVLGARQTAMSSLTTQG